MDSLGGSGDPAALTEAAHATASMLVESGRTADDAAARGRLVALVDEVGLDTIAELWAPRPPRSLPGALWRLYALREWVRRESVEISGDFVLGTVLAPVPHVVAGAADPPNPEAVRALVDQVLHGVFAGDLDVALERAGAFCRVVVAGRARRADDIEDSDPAAAATLTRSAASLRDTAADLEAAAALWRNQGLV